MARGAALLLLVVPLAVAGEAPRALVLEHEDPHTRAVGAAALLREAGFDAAELDLAAGDARHVEEIVDEPHELPDLAGHDLPGARGRVYPGIGVAASESQLRADAVIEQVLALRAAGAAGFVLFDLCQPLQQEVLPALQRGLTRRVP